jgi:nitroreductase
MELFKALHTQRAIRRFKSDPVPDELVRRVLDAAIRAPSGGNSQPWVFLVLKDADLKSRVGAFYKQGWDHAGLSRLATDPDPSRARVYSSASYLAERMGEASVLILVCVRGSGGRVSTTSGASIYPAVQNLMLAAMGLGLGTVLTTVHRHREAEIKALLGIPQDVDTVALVPMGYPAEGVRFGPTRRRPLEEVAFRDTWGQAF